MSYNDFLQNFLKEFLNIKSFKGKIDYANQNLTRIGSGSGRIVYDIDGTKVFKLAKNTKGVAQNAEEASVNANGNNDFILTKIFEFADDDTWLIAEKAKKVTERRIKELTGIRSLNDLFYYLRNYKSQMNGGRKIFGQDSEIEEELANNEFVQDLTNFIDNHSAEVGDFGRPSSYGEVLHDGQPTIVLTDYGLSDEVYDTYYNPQKKQSQKIYELYNFQDGNDDILSDIGNTGEVRHNMWGLMPYSVSDGNGVINEDFISFVLNRDKYPTRVLPSAPYLLDNFHDCVNNINEVLNHVDNKKKFYNNLLELQDYLIRGKFYDREPLEKEMVELNEEDTPVVEPMRLDNEYANNIATMFSEKMNLGQPQYLGGGSYGFAYSINGNKILKLTTDVSEVDAGLKIQRAKPKSLVDIYSIYKLIDSEKNLAVYALIEDNIINKPIDEFKKYIKIINELSASENDDFVGLMILLKKKKYDEFIESSKQILTNKPEANIVQADREKAYKFIQDLFEIKKELDELAIKSNDYSNVENLGYKNGVLTYFDIGGYRANDIQIPQQNNIMLPEGEELLDESVSRENADTIANKVAEIYKLNQPKFIGSGNFGAAYDIGNDKILKVTSDKSEAVENLGLIGKQLKYIAEPYNVFSIKSKSNADELYVIILEKLKTNGDYFIKIRNKLNFAFEKILGVKLSDVIDFYIDGYGNNVNKDKINKYLSKNPEDAEYFNGLLKIAEEAKKHGVESMDYLNPENLGYKKDGSIGFFDVGFGNYYAKSNKQPEEVEIDETKEINNDNLNKLREQVFNSKNVQEFLKNIITDFDVRYEMRKAAEPLVKIEDIKNIEKYKENQKLNNEVILAWEDVIKNGKRPFIILRNNNHIDGNHKLQAYKNLRFNKIPVLRENDLINFYNKIKNSNIDEDGTSKFSTDDGIGRDDFPLYDQNDTSVLTDNNVPSGNDNIISNNGHEYNVNERVLSSMAGSSSVDVKKKCRLGGLGNTSIACNQGDVKNFNIKSLKEEDFPEYEKQIEDEGVGDTYAEKEFNIQNTNGEFNNKYNKEMNKENQEEIIKIDTDYKKDINIIKNPKSLNNIAPSVRGLIDREGNLFVEEKNSVVHDNLINGLYKIGILKRIPLDWYSSLPTEFVTVQRYGKTNKFLLGESNETMIPDSRRNTYDKSLNLQSWNKLPTRDEAAPFYQKFLDKAKIKNPNIEFINDKITYYGKEESKLNETIVNEIENFLNEKSVHSLNTNDVITPEYLKILKQNNNYEPFVNRFKYENNIEWNDEIDENSKEFQDWLMNELSDRYYDVVRNIRSKIKPDNRIDIWRMMTVENGWVIHLMKEGKHLGIYWSWEENAAEAHWGQSGNNRVLIKSSIKEENIDWENTVALNMDINIGEDEKEIRLFKNTPLKIEELYMNNKNIIDDLEVSQIKNKTFYA